MNILILNWRGPGHPNEGGAEQATLEHAKRLVKNGHKVTWFTSKYPGGKSREKIAGIEMIRKGNQVLGVQIAAFFWYKFSNHQKFDLVIDQFHGIPFFTPFYTSTKKLAYIHETTKEVWSMNPWPFPLNKIPSLFGTLIEPKIFRFYRNTPFLTVSESTKKDLIAWNINQRQIKVIRNGFTPVKVETKPQKKKVAIFLGALAKDKGIEDAIETFEIVAKTESDWNFWLVGKCSSNFQNKLQAMCKSKGLEKQVKFWGYVSEKRKYELMSKSRALVNPSFREGWGLVNIEANSVGTPVIGYKVAGMVDSVKSGYSGILCDENSPDCLADELLKLVNNKPKYEKMVKNSIKWSKNFSWEKSTQESLEYIESLS